MNQTKWVLRNVGIIIHPITSWRYFCYFRKIVSLFLRNFLPIVSLPGPIEIDEMHLGARVRGAHGRLPVPSQTIFGICRQTLEAI